MAAAAGLTLIERWESFDRSPFGPDSERHVSVFCKGTRVNPGCVRPSTLDNP
jgi:hypothetical protein